MVYTAVTDRSTIDLATIKTLLGITGTAYDVLLTLWLSAAKSKADRFLNNPFLERNPDFDVELPISDTNPFWTEPVVELAIPADVDLGVVAYIEWHFLMKGRPKDLTEEKSGDLQRKYARYADVADLIAHVQATYWQGYRLSPWG